MRFHPYIEQHRSHFEEAETKYGLKPGLLMAIAQQETGWSRAPDLAKLTSPVGAQGLMQFMPATAKDFNIDPRDPIQAIDGAGRYFQRLGKLFDNDLEKMIASYNAGEGAVMDYMNGTNKTKKNPKLRSGTFPPFQENIKYRKSVLNMLDSPSVQQALDDVPFTPLGANPNEPFNVLKTKTALQAQQKQVELFTQAQEEPESADFFPQVSARLQGSLSGVMLTKLSEAIAKDAQEDFGFMEELHTEQGVASTKYTLTNIIGLPETDTRFEEALSNLQEAKNELHYNLKVRHMTEHMENQKLLGSTYGISSNLGALLTGSEMKGLKAKDVAAEVASMLLMPESHLPVALAARGAAAVVANGPRIAGTMAAAKKALGVGAEADEIAMVSAEAAHASKILQFTKNPPLWAKAAIPVVAGAELAAVQGVIEANEAIPVTEEQLGRDMLLAGGAAALLTKLFGGTSTVTGAMQAAAKKRLDTINQNIVEGLSPEMAARQEVINAVRANALDTVQTAARADLTEQLISRLKAVEAREDIQPTHKVAIQQEYFNSLDVLNQHAYFQQLKEIAGSTGMFKELIEAIQNASQKDAIAVMPVDALGPIEKGLKAKTKRAYTKAYPKKTAFSYTEETGAPSPSKEFADSFTNAVAQENRLDKDTLASAQPILRAGMRHLGPTLSTAHWLFSKTADPTAPHSALLNAFTLKMFGEGAGKVQTSAGEIAVASSGVVAKATNRAQETVRIARGTVFPMLSKYANRTGKSWGKAEGDLNELIMTGKVDGVDAESLQMLQGAREAYEEVFKDLLDNLFLRGVIPEDAYKRIVASTAKVPYFPRAFDVQVVNRMLVEKGLTDNDLFTLIEGASISHAQKSGRFVVDASGAFVHPDASFLLNEITWAEKELADGAKIDIPAIRKALKRIDSRLNMSGTAAVGSRKIRSLVSELKNEIAQLDPATLSDAQRSLSFALVEGGDKGAIKDLARKVLKEKQASLKIALEAREAGREITENTISSLRAQLDGFDGQVRKGMTAGAKKYVQTMRDMFYRADMDNAGIALSNEEYTRLAEEVRKSIMDATSGLKASGHGMQPEDIHQAILDAAYIHTNSTNATTVDALLHRAPIDTGFSMVFKNKEGGDVQLSVAEIYGTKSPLITAENTIRSLQGALTLAEEAGITQLKHIDSLIKEGTKGLAGKEGQEVSTFMEQVFNTVRGLPTHKRNAWSDLRSFATPLVYVNYGALFPIGQALEPIATAFKHPKTAMKVLFGDSKHAQKHLEDIYTAIHNADSPNSSKINNQLLAVTTDLAKVSAFEGRNVFDDPLRSLQHAEPGSIDKAILGMQHLSVVSNKLNLHAMRRLVEVQKNGYMKVGLMEIEDIADSYLPKRSAALDKIKSKFPDIYAENKAFFDDFFAQEKAMMDVLTDSYPEAASELLPLIEEMTLPKSGSYAIFTEMGLKAKDALNALKVAKALKDGEQFHVEHATKLRDSLEKFSDDMLYAGSIANAPKFFMDYPVLTMLFQLGRFAFEAWNNISHRLLAHPTEAKLWAALFGAQVAAIFSQEIIGLVGTALPAAIGSGSVSEGLKKYEEKRQERMTPKKGDNGIFGLSSDYVYGLVARNAAFSSLGMGYRLATAVSETAPKPEFLRSSGLPSKGVIESTPAFSAIAGSIGAPLAAAQAVIDEPSQQNVRAMINQTPLINFSFYTKLLLQSTLYSDWYEGLPKTASSK